MKHPSALFLFSVLSYTSITDAEVLEFLCRTSGDRPAYLHIDTDNNTLRLGNVDYDIVDKSRYFVTAYQKMQSDRIGGSTIVVNIALGEYIRGYAGLPDHTRKQLDNMAPRDLPALEAGGFTGRCYEPY